MTFNELGPKAEKPKTINVERQGGLNSEDFMIKIDEDVAQQRENAEAMLKSGKNMGLSKEGLAKIEADTGVNEKIETLQKARETLSIVTKRKLLREVNEQRGEEADITEKIGETLHMHGVQEKNI